MDSVTFLQMMTLSKKVHVFTCSNLVWEQSEADANKITSHDKIGIWRVFDLFRFE